MIKLITEYCVRDNDDDEAADARADELYRVIMGFAQMVNASIVNDDDRFRSYSYVVVRVTCGGLSHGVIRDHGQIRGAIRGWCKALKAWVYDCHEDENFGDDKFVVVIRYSWEDCNLDVRFFGKEDADYSNALDGFSVTNLEQEL